METMGRMDEAERFYREELRLSYLPVGTLGAYGGRGRGAKGVVDEGTLASVENLERFLKDWAAGCL